LITLIDTFNSGVRYICTSKSRIEHVFLHYFPATLQLRNSPGDYAGELFKCSKDVPSLWVFGFQVFCEWHHKWGRF